MMWVILAAVPLLTSALDTWKYDSFWYKNYGGYKMGNCYGCTCDMPKDNEVGHAIWTVGGCKEASKKLQVGCEMRSKTTCTKDVFEDKIWEINSTWGPAGCFTTKVGGVRRLFFNVNTRNTQSNDAVPICNTDYQKRYTSTSGMNMVIYPIKFGEMGRDSKLTKCDNVLGSIRNCKITAPEIRQLYYYFRNADNFKRAVASAQFDDSKMMFLGVGGVMIVAAVAAVVALRSRKETEENDFVNI